MSDGTPMIGTYTDGYVDALDNVLDHILTDAEFSGSDDEADKSMWKLVREIIRLFWPKRVPVPGAYR